MGTRDQPLPTGTHKLSLQYLFGLAIWQAIDLLRHCSRYNFATVHSPRVRDPVLAVVTEGGLGASQYPDCTVDHASAQLRPNQNQHRGERGREVKKPCEGA